MMVTLIALKYHQINSICLDYRHPAPMGQMSVLMVVFSYMLISTVLLFVKYSYD